MHLCQQQAKAYPLPKSVLLFVLRTTRFLRFFLTGCSSSARVFNSLFCASALIIIESIPSTTQFPHVGSGLPISCKYTALNSTFCSGVILSTCVSFHF